MFVKLIKQFLSTIFTPRGTGWIPDEVDERDAQWEPLFGISNESLPKSVNWLSELKLKRQGAAPLCVSFGISHIQARNQKVNDGWTVDLSPRFLASRGKTSPRGANIRTILEVLRIEGCVLENECPFNPDEFRWANFWKLLNISFLTPDQLERAKRNKIAGYARVDSWNKMAIKTALQSGPVLFGIFLTKNWGWGGTVSPVGSFGLGHVVVCAGYDDDRKCWIVGDSLEPQEKYVSYNYPISSVWAITDLPDNWKELQEEHLYNSYSRLLKERFGKTRDLANEQAEAQLLKKLIEPLVKKRPELGGILGKYWIVGIACFYGGWTLKDFIDDCIYYADNGKHRYNFNEEKPE